jgi:K+-transporting ATPase ATPase C chain
METSDEKKRGMKSGLRPIIGMAFISLLLCGLFFPLLITGIAQAVLPYQANGELVQLNGKTVGSNLIAENFTLPVFFHERNVTDSASGVDPDITVQNAYSQISRISNASGIPVTALRSLVDSNTEGTLWIFGSPYVNVLKLNLLLISHYPSAYARFA